MEIQSVFEKAFASYGKVIEGHNWQELTEKLVEISEKPLHRVIYVPGDKTLEALPLAKTIEDHLFGGMPIQIGYCNGENRALNCLEYHRGSEVNIPADDIILLVAPLSAVENGQISTEKVEAFLAPAGKAVLLYETCLHYAPCSVKAGAGFRVAVVLPRGTNTEKPNISPVNDEDRLLWARNKWLIAHRDSTEATAGAHLGLVGENIVLP